MDRRMMEKDLERIRRSMCMRMDADDDLDIEEPEEWITLENGQHVPLDGSGRAMGGAGGWAKGRDFSNAKSTGRKKKKTEGKKTGPAKGGYEYPLIDVTTGTNKKSASSLKKMGKQLDDSLDEHHINEGLRSIIEEDSAVRIFPTDGKGFTSDWVMCKTADEKKALANRVIDGAIKEMEFRLTVLRQDPGYDYEIAENMKYMEYYRSLKKELNGK